MLFGLFHEEGGGGTHQHEQQALEMGAQLPLGQDVHGGLVGPRHQCQQVQAEGAQLLAQDVGDGVGGELLIQCAVGPRHQGYQVQAVGAQLLGQDGEVVGGEFLSQGAVGPRHQGHQVQAGGGQLPCQGVHGGIGEGEGGDFLLQGAARMKVKCEYK